MKYITNSLIFIFILSLGLVSCQRPQTNVAEVKKTIEENSMKFVNAYNSKDLATVMSFYAPDALVLPQNGPAVSGRGSIEATFRQFLATSRNLNVSLKKVDASTDLAYEIGTYTLTFEMPGMPAMPDTGKYVTLWKRQPDGKWLIVGDIFNTDLPMPQPSAMEEKKMEKKKM